NLQDTTFFFRVGISGTVYGDKNRDGRLGLRERGLAGQTVELLNADTGEVVTSTTTDARGGYRFDVSNGLRLGRFQVRVVLTNGGTQTPANLPLITLTRGETFVTQVNLGVAS